MKSRLFLFVFAICSSYWVAASRDDSERFTTDRKSPVELKLPDEDNSFVFAVFGDRTGGPADGVQVLVQAVADVNLVDPDLVMTVGDLVEGYNQTARWKDQAREFSGIMDELSSPWYPVAGNHDIYWRGEGRPQREHTENYEEHFGPLWYAFRHKQCWFISLFTDEGNPDTGEYTFNKPGSQRMSPEQFSFLERTLERAAEARHVFVFLHHPRWHAGRYGDDWEHVHDLLAKAGNVTAVFAGHIHHMVYDGVRDGIEYFTLATVGGHQAGDAAEAGYLHHWNLVTVREEGLAVTTFPVGAAMDPRLITPQVGQAARQLIDGLHPSFSQSLMIRQDQDIQEELLIEVPNPTDRPIEVAIALESQDSRWRFAPDHDHALIPAGESHSFAYGVARDAGVLDAGFRPPVAQMTIDYLAATHRVTLPSRALAIPMSLEALEEPKARSIALEFDGERDHLRIEHNALALPDGPFTLECWLRGRDFRGRRGLINKTEGSEFGFFVNDGVPNFIVHLAGSYVSAEASAVQLQSDTWYHLAGVFDGEEVRLYLDGKPVASALGAGARTLRNIPLLIGADVTGSGSSTSHFQGVIDEVRLSTSVRYRDAFVPVSRHEALDDSTLLLLHLDERTGMWAFDSSAGRRHARFAGTPKLVAR
ncbi:MAG: hypothetical protein ACI9F9_002672 [Candidatus Paceibacteria bacterium]|jgi:hypothetical protein